MILFLCWVATKCDVMRLHGQAVKTSPFHGGNTSSNLVGVIWTYCSIYADVAQLAEQLICNQQVIGSSPIIGFLLWEEFNIAGWSSLEARRAHNPKVVGSNPAPAI